jgi:hypothetical protein
VRHCNWDPCGKTKTTSGCFIMGAKCEEEGQTYKQLQDMCPSVVNEVEEALMFRKMANLAQMKKPRSRTPANQRHDIYAKEFMSFQEPLRTFINKFREWLRMQGKKRRVMNQEAAEYLCMENPGVVQLNRAGTPTFHSYRRANMFVAGEFGAALLLDMEKSFTAVHVHLPRDLGDDGNSQELEIKLTTMMESILNTTTKQGVAVKVHFPFVSWHVNFISVFGSEN